MLSGVALAVVLTAVPPVPPPKPELQRGADPSTGVVAAPAQATALPERNTDDMTVLELMLNDLGQVRNSDATEPEAEVAVDLTDARESRASGTARRAQGGVPVPTARPIVLAPANSSPRTQGVMICNDPRLTGRRTTPVSGKYRGCGISAPVQVTAVNGIKLSTPATVRCDTARTFADWLTGVADPHAREDLGAGISSVRVMASYSCRPRNHRKGARLSEHSYGRAIDVGGFRLTNGRQVSVLESWNKGSAGRYLRRIWRRACGPFTTVLGPESDRHHRDHFHFDIADRNSRYCR